MKKKRYLFLLSIICLSFLLIRCGKDGAIGPQGNAGDKGAAGAVGPAGPKGADGSDGSIIYSGKGVPATATGKAGDFYLNTATGLLYGPKTAAGWGTGFSLKGATGAAGTAGSTTLSGAGLPAASLGKTGDYYLDKTNYLLYGPKTGSDWGVPVNLRGPAGPQGAPGNANVKVDVFTVNTGDWIYYSSYYFEIQDGLTSRETSKYFDRSNSLITPALLSSGLVLVYFQSAPSVNTDQWQPLPFTFNFFGDYNFNYAYETSAGNVRLHFYFTDGSKLAPNISTYDVPAHQFKIVIVSGTLIGSIHQNHINVNNYSEVSRFLAIQ